MRTAQLGDAAEIARLSGELGYPCSAEEMAARLGDLIPQSAHRIAVAEAADGSLLGWVAVESRLSVEGGRAAEIVGLVVDGRARRLGVGARLVSAAEEWSRSLGHATLVVRSNAARLESHPFYETHGYSKTKTQHVYRKQLAV